MTPSQIHLSELEAHFENLFHNPDSELLEINEYTNVGNHDYCFSSWECPSYLNEDISEVEILNEIQQAPTKKASGTNGITNEVLKSSFGIILPFLAFLFNICFENGVLPTAWKASYVTTLYKGKGSKTDANSYRGISLLSCLYKIYTGIIYKRLQVWADEILPPSQFGFRKGKSTIDAAKTLRDNIHLYVNSSSGKYYACFIDFEKAFDTVDRNLLLEKLIRYGLQGKTLQMVRVICETNFQYIVDGGHRSREIPQSRGVAQGDKLSPMLFSLYIADMHYYLQDHNVNVIF